ncbi:MAG TPA: OmpA family protein [Cytophagaceae bacterium]
MRDIFTGRIITIVLIILLIGFGSCRKWSRTAKGGAIGAGSGAAIGGVIGKATGNTAVGILVGAAIGGTAGAAIGKYMDKQAYEIRKDLENAKVERIGEGIKITFPSGILFDLNSATLKPESKENLRDLAGTLNKYKDTDIVIQGYTDNTGTEEYNQQLSERRAEAVGNYLRTLGVDVSRLSPVGMGESEPVADNATEAGRMQNRRVEIAIFANEKLKKAARRGDI